MIVVRLLWISVRLIDTAVLLPWSQDPTDGPYYKLQSSSYHPNCKICFIIVHLRLCLPNGLFISGSSTKLFCKFLFCPQSNTCRLEHILMTLIIFGYIQLINFLLCPAPFHSLSWLLVPSVWTDKEKV
jgi:hypothetical protein